MTHYIAPKFIIVVCNDLFFNNIDRIPLKYQYITIKDMKERIGIKEVK